MNGGCRHPSNSGGIMARSHFNTSSLGGMATFTVYAAFPGPVRHYPRGIRRLR